VFNPPNLEGLSVEQAANAARQWLGLADTNDFESYREAIEAKGVLVFRSNGYNGKWQIAKENPILGFALYDEVCPVIVVKKQPWETQQCFTLMHELGHILLHKASSLMMSMICILPKAWNVRRMLLLDICWLPMRF